MLFVSPLCAWSSALFSVRVVHHIALTTIVAPLLAAALAPAALARLPGGLGGWTAAHVVLLWMWHAPPLYAAALGNDAIFWAMQLSLIASATGYWAAIRRAEAPGAVIALLLAMVAMGLLGALITFAGAPLYAPHLVSTFAWGLDPLEDQQLAGLIMWAPAALLYLFAALYLLGRYIARAERAPAAPC